jgi:hypothetical protein
MALVAIAASCGGERPDGDLAQSVTLGPPDLPKAAHETESPIRDSDCNPSANFEDLAVALVNPSEYGIETTTLHQTVGTFDSPAEASRAFAQVTSRENDECTIAEMHREALERSGKAGRGRISRLEVPVGGGYTTDGTRFQLTLPTEGVFFDTYTIRRGRTIVCLGFLARPEEAPKHLRVSLVRKASARLLEAFR